MSSATTSLLSRLAISPFRWTKASISGRWWQQPPRAILCPDVSRRLCSSSQTDIIPSTNPGDNEPSPSCDHSPSSSSIAVREHVHLSRVDAAPIYAPSLPITSKRYGTVEGRNGELLADYVLFEDSINKAKCLWVKYDELTSHERDIYMAHLKAICERKLSYRDPETRLMVMTISQLLLNERCCGNGCRHCPYGMENADVGVKKTKKWNGAFYV